MSSLDGRTGSVSPTGPVSPIQTLPLVKAFDIYEYNVYLFISTKIAIATLKNSYTNEMFIQHYFKTDLDNYNLLYNAINEFIHTYEESPELFEKETDNETGNNSWVEIGFLEYSITFYNISRCPWLYEYVYVTTSTSDNIIKFICLDLANQYKCVILQEYEKFKEEGIQIYEGEITSDITTMFNFLLYIQDADTTDTTDNTDNTDTIVTTGNIDTADTVNTTDSIDVTDVIDIKVNIEVDYIDLVIKYNSKEIKTIIKRL